MRLLFIDGSTKLDTVRDLETKARGGMVTSLFKVTDYLARAGHVVEVLSDIQYQGTTAAGVDWVHRYSGPYDAIVCNRGIGDGYPDVDTKTRILWTHDLPHAGFISEPEKIRAFTTVFMSEYAERVWRAFYRDIGKSYLIPNGVDKAIFHPRTKDPNKIIYASAPNRGLDKLPFIFDSIQAATDRPLKCVAYSSLAKLHPGEGEDKFDYEAIRKSSVELKDPLPQREFAEELSRAAMMILPSAYPEICSNAILQSLACGTPVITTGNMGSAHEWVDKRTLTKFQPHDYMIYPLEITRIALGVLNGYKLKHAKVYSWDEIGEKWESMLRRLA